MAAVSRYLLSMLQSVLPAASSTAAQPQDSPLYADDAPFLPSSARLSAASSSSFSKPSSVSAPSLQSVRLTTDALAASVRSSIRTFNPTSPTKSDMRLLLLGSHAAHRAHHLTHSGKGDFPSDSFALGEGKGGAGGAVFHSEDVQELDDSALCSPAAFDAVLCFNATGLCTDSDDGIQRLTEALRPGGVIAGLGLFLRPESGDHSSVLPSSASSPSSSSLSSSSAPSCLPLTLLEFRSRVEFLGLVVHTAVDLSLEGSLALHVMEDARFVCSRAVEATSGRRSGSADGYGSQQQQMLSALQAGRLIAARFLATKPTALRPLPQLRVQTGSSSVPALPSPAQSKLSVETQLWSLSMSLSNGLQSFSSPYAEHSRSSSALSAVSFASPLSCAEPVVISGVSLGLPNGLYPDRSVFSPDNFASIFRGDNFISSLSAEQKRRILEQNVCQVYKKDGQRVKYRLQQDSEVIQVAAIIRDFDLGKEYPYVPAHVVEVLDTTYGLAIAAGLEALKDAGIDVLEERQQADGQTVRVIRGLPEHMRDDTGVIFASSFPCLDSLTEEVSKSAAARARRELRAEAAEAGHPLPSVSDSEPEYEYDRKLLFKLLVMANSQLAELVKARGPNTHINNACSGTTQAIAVAEDWIKVGRCKRVIVIAADHATSQQLFPYLATGFLALGAATTAKELTDAACPFDSRRRGMILGAGAVGLVLEAASVCCDRVQPKVEVLGTCISNSAFHASLMDAATCSHQLGRFMSRMEQQHRLDRHAMAEELIYFSHETSTHSNGGCAKVEMDALTAAFSAASKQRILLANTKGFTGHPMGVGMEDVVAVQSLHTGLVPPIANHKTTDPLLGLRDDQLPRVGAGGAGDPTPPRHQRRYVLRFAAGFGSQFAYVLYRKWDGGAEPEEETEGVGSASSTPR